MKISKHKDGYYARINTGERQQEKDGKPGAIIYKAIYGKTKKEVEEKIKEFEKELSCKSNYNKKNMPTLDEVAQRYLSVIKQDTDVAWNTWYAYNRVYKSRVQDVIGFKKINEITRMQLEDILLKAKQEAPGVAVQLSCVCKNIFKYAILNNIITDNVTLYLKTPSVEHKKREPIKLMELKALFYAPLKTKDRLFAFVLVFCGLRRGEALALKYPNFHEGYIEVLKQIVFNEKGTGMLSPTKTEESVRMVESYTEVTNLYNEIVADSKNLKTEYVFGNIHRPGKEPCHTKYNYMWKRICRVVGWSNITPHRLRHTFITYLHQVMPPKEAQLLTGHKSIQVLLDIYTHLDATENLQNYKGKLSDFFDKLIKGENPDKGENPPTNI